MFIVGRTWMIPGSSQLGPEGLAYDDLIKFAFAANDIDHQVQVDMSIKVDFGAKVFGKCKRVGRKTCDGVTGSSRGTNYISFENFAVLFHYFHQIYKSLIFFIITIQEKITLSL